MYAAMSLAQSAISVTDTTSIPVCIYFWGIDISALLIPPRYEVIPSKLVPVLPPITSS